MEIDADVSAVALLGGDRLMQAAAVEDYPLSCVYKEFLVLRLEKDRAADDYRYLYLVVPVEHALEVFGVHMLLVHRHREAVVPVLRELLKRSVHKYRARFQTNHSSAQCPAAFLKAPPYALRKICYCFHYCDYYTLYITKLRCLHG